MLQQAALFFSAPKSGKIRLPRGGGGIGERKGLANTVFSEEGSTGKDFLKKKKSIIYFIFAFRLFHCGNIQF
jgi:hypothetical protein